MLENTISLLPHDSARDKAMTVMMLGQESESLDELERLLHTLGVSTLGRFVYQPRKIHPGTYVTEGKLAEAKVEAEGLGAHAIVFDFELSPRQLQNVEKAVGLPCMDRPGVIIEIFSKRAQSKEAKTQVEIARLKYLAPRLTGFWTHFERQRGGGSANRGMGEKQIEIDRRLLKKRVNILEARLKEIRSNRELHREARKEVSKVAIVGYTNAGKSTLLNALTESTVLAEDKLFATLDSSVRALDPNCHPPVVAIDTVGFIRRLPHDLVASFRSTLEEVCEADLILHVLDGGSGQVQDEMAVTLEVLKDLGADQKPRMTVFNKSDTVKDPARKNWAKIASPGSIWVSALDLADVKKLREMILNHFRSTLEVYEVFIPYSDSRVENHIFQHGEIEKKTHFDHGTFYRFKMAEADLKRFALQRYRI